MPRRGRAPLVPVPRQTARQDDDGDGRTRPERMVRAIERRARRERHAEGGGVEVPLENGVAARQLPRDARGGRVCDFGRPRGRRAPALSRPQGARRRWRADVRPNPRDGEALLGADGRPVPLEQVRADRRLRLHLRRDGEHHRHDDVRAHPARHACGHRRHIRRSHRARARTSVVRRLRHVPRLVRGVVERRVRDVPRAGVARAPSRRRRVRVLRPSRSRRLPLRGERPLPPPDRLLRLRLAARSVR